MKRRNLILYVSCQRIFLVHWKGFWKILDCSNSYDFCCSANVYIQEQSFHFELILARIKPKINVSNFSQRKTILHFFQFFDFGSISRQSQFEMKYSILNIDVSAAVKVLRFETQHANMEKFPKNQKHSLARTIQHEISSLEVFTFFSNFVGRKHF